MRRLPVNAVRAQRGYSLISMMVGLLISLLTIAAMLSVYKMVVEVSGQASADAQRDGQVASGLLAAQVELHNAGYRISDLPLVVAGGKADEALIKQYAIAVKDDDKRVVTWRSEAGCARLQIVPATDGSASVFFNGPEACSDIASASWSKPRQVLVDYAGSWKQRDGTAVGDAASGLYLGMDKAASDSGFRVVNADGERCTLPYAQQRKANITTESPRLVLENKGQELFSICLSNIVAARAASAGTSPISGGSP